MTTAQEIESLMLEMKNEKQRQVLCRFFKTGKGEYGEGDMFIGIKVPQTRAIVKEARLDVELSEISKLFHSPWHEIRLCGFLLLVEEMKAALPRLKRKKEKQTADADIIKARRRKEIAAFYLGNARQANNWDLVDLSAPYIIGNWLLHPDESDKMADRHILDRLAESSNLWEQRIAIVSTLMLIRNHQFDDTMRIAEKLLPHRHDLIHKAVGWMLREAGKRDINTLRQFLQLHYSTMPRTALRYAIEKMSLEERKKWMKR